MTDKSPKNVMVTGASGYLASWIVKMLLEEGHTVHGTVRDASQKDKTAHLDALNREHGGRLKLFEADLLKEGSSKQAMEGCGVVIHTASPFFIQNVKSSEKELIKPALEGTRNVLQSVNVTPEVQKVVLTSSMVAIYGDSRDIKKTEKGYFTEEHWNETSSASNQPYPYSKTLAEREAWKIHDSQDRWALAVINPGFILGPSVSERLDGASVSFMKQLGDGTFKQGVPEYFFGVVDVRDVSRAHVLAAFNPDASGRYITCNTVMSMPDMAKIIRDNYPEYPVPKSRVPKPMFWLLAPLFGIKRREVAKNVGIPINFDNVRSREIGLTYRPVDETLIEHFKQMVENGVLQAQAA